MGGGEEGQAGCLSHDLLASGGSGRWEKSSQLWGKVMTQWIEGQGYGLRKTQGISGVTGLCISVSLIVCLSPSETNQSWDSLGASWPLFLFLCFLRSDPLREMSARDKDTGKTPGRVGRKRGQGRKDS